MFWLWLKALHVVFMVSWFAGIFYLPRLFVYHAMATGDAAGQARFVVMERKLYRGIMNPSALLTLASGLGLLYGYGWAAFGRQGWLHAKLLLVAGLVVFHLVCGAYARAFAAGHNRHGHRFYRVFNELPVLVLLAICILVIVKPGAYS